MDLEFNKNEDELQQLTSALKQRISKTALGGGQKRIDKHHAKGKLTARERVAYLLDKGSEFLEIGTLAADGMYADHGGCPSAGVVAGIGRVSKKLCMIVANDATVKAGAWFPMTAKKNLRAQEIAIENRLPLIYLVDSAGIYLPMQDEVFADKEHFGRMFRNNARISSMGIVQVSAIMGACVAGGAYLPIMSDEAMIVEGTGSIFLAGPYLLKAAIGETVDKETLGGAETHCEISGVTDNSYETDEKALDAIREIFAKLGSNVKAGFSREKSIVPKKDTNELYGVLPVSRLKPYDMKEIIGRLVDDSVFQQYKPGYGKSILCGTSRIDGWAVGIVANQRTVEKTKSGELKMGGVIYSDSADKAARFIMNCNQRKIPLLFIHDVTGFMVGTRSEHGGIIKDGAKMVSAVANSVVPKITLIVGNSYGAGNYAMCGKAYDPRFIFAWPTAKIGVMSASSAGQTLLQIKKASLKAQGKEISPEDEKALLDEVSKNYEATMTPYHAASRLWVDDIIDPLETRGKLSMALEACNEAPITEAFNPGIMQT